MKPAAALQRQVFTTSRDLDFVGHCELAAQIGYPPEVWREIAVKELVDNALDAAEDAGLAPRIEIGWDADTGSVSVTDHGPGLLPEVVTRIADFATRTSSREAYVGISRGAQGNAWMTLIAMPYALGGGQVTIDSHGHRHRLVMRPDPLTLKIQVEHQRHPGLVQNGTRVEMVSASWIGDLSSRISQLATDLATFNPAARIVLDGQPVAEPVEDWPGKWPTSAPSPMHWYSLDRLERLTAACISATPDMPVREFLRTFDGMRRTDRMSGVLGELDLARQPVKRLQNDDDGAVDRMLLERLREAVVAATKPASAKRLGRIGQPAFARLGTVLACGGKLVEDPCAPAVVEAALVAVPDGEDIGDHVLGINFTAPASPGFAGQEHLLGRHQLLHPNAVGRVRLVAHITCPAITFADRGKRQATLPREVEHALAMVVGKAAAPWRDAVERAIRQRRTAEVKPPRDRRASIRDAAFDAMPNAYMKASANGTLPAAPRQIMYAARPAIEDATGRKLKDDYFIQELLWDFIEANSELTAGWRIAVDPRGNFTEPHTSRRVPLGTLQVENYLGAWQHALPEMGAGISFARRDVATHGPPARYGAVLFVEKEGFTSIFEAAKLQERFDLAIMSTKGMSVTAARQLVDALAKRGVRTYCIRDFDVTGFTIAGTLRADTRRYVFNTEGAIDLGLRLPDVEALGLAREHAFHRGPGGKKLDADQAEAKLGPTLRKYDATEAEVRFLATHRVELNAIASDVLIAWIEGKLAAAGVGKVVPDPADLEMAARNYAVIDRANEILASADLSLVAVPPGQELEVAVRRVLQARPELAWVAALRLVLDEMKEE